MYTAFLLILFHFDLTGIRKYLFPWDFAINEILQFSGLSFHLWVCGSCVLLKCIMFGVEKWRSYFWSLLVILGKSLNVPAPVHLPGEGGKNCSFHFARLWERKVTLLENSLKSWKPSFYMCKGFYNPDQFYFLFRVYDLSLFCQRYFVLKKKNHTSSICLSYLSMASIWGKIAIGIKHVELCRRKKKHTTTFLFPRDCLFLLNFQS